MFDCNSIILKMKHLSFILATDMTVDANNVRFADVMMHSALI